MTDGCIDHLVVPGTFDPITYGHLDVVRRARLLCKRVTVAVAASMGKNGVGTTFTLDERVDMATKAVAALGLDGIDVVPLRGLLVDLCHSIGAQAIVKGLRATTDFEYELSQANLNCHIAPDIESVFIMSNPKYGYISSSIVRELAEFGADVGDLVPPDVALRLEERFSGAGAAGADAMGDVS